MYYIVLILVTSVLVAADDQNDAHFFADCFARRCAASILPQEKIHRKKRIDHEEEPRQNPLKRDTEQQQEHYASVRDLINSLQGKVEQENNQAALREYEQTCRVIAAFLLRAQQQKEEGAIHALEHCLEIVARVKLLQDPEWRSIIVQSRGQCNSSEVPVYAPDELDDTLPLYHDAKHTRVASLLHELQNETTEELVFLDCDLDDLEQHLRMFKPLDRAIMLVTQLTDPKNTTYKMFQSMEQSAKDLYNQAVHNEIRVMLQIEKNKDKHALPQFELALRAVALTYLKAHDEGHPSALRQVIDLMNSNAMDKIITWKQKHMASEQPLASYTAIWQEINTRKKK